MTYTPIAVVGMGCRLPGKIHSPAQFWELLTSGTDALQEVPADRWNQEYYHSPDRSNAGTIISPRGGFIDNADMFDNGFFGIPALEAANIDPQQRLMLMAAWEAMEQGAIPADKWAGKEVGVFMGCFTDDYKIMQFIDPVEMGAFAATGIMNTMLSNRLSYTFDFKGPSMSIDTACSASLTAVHQACMSLHNGECVMALAGGAMLMLTPDLHIAETRTGLLSRDGQCRSFSADANGYVRSEGIGVVVLKRLEDAIAQGDNILAVIRGSAINQDGRTSGITQPNGTSQKEVMRAACKAAGIHPSEVSFVEAHGTGTPTGDPIEANAIGSVFRQEAGCDDTLWVGSCKSNIGHTESAAGICGLIKTVLCLQHRQLPPNLHAQNLNPVIRFDKLHIRIPITNEPLAARGGTLIAGVNSFGFGGANAHVLLSAYEKPAERRVSSHPSSFICPLSAASDIALRDMARTYAQQLDHISQSELGNWCYNVAIRRSVLPRKKAFVANSAQDLRDQLLQFAASPASNEQKPFQHKTVWVYSGAGHLTYGMSMRLLDEEPVFRQMYMQCEDIYTGIAGHSVFQLLKSGAPGDEITDPRIAHIAQFFHQVSLSALWRSRGMKPDILAGYSTGEFASFYEAGVYTLEECLELLYHRTQVVNNLQDTGSMAAINAGAALINDLTNLDSCNVHIACYNSKDNLTLSGKTADLERVTSQLTDKGISFSYLPERIAYHYPGMLTTAEQEVIMSYAPQPSHPQIPLYSTTTGGLVTNNIAPDIWLRNLLQPVLFDQVLDAISVTHRVQFLELSGRTMLLPYIHANALPLKASILNPATPQAGIREDLQTLAAAFTADIAIDWHAIYPYGQWMPLPSYPWQQERFWHEPAKSIDRRLRPTIDPLLGARVYEQQGQWEAKYDIKKMPWLLDHKIMDEAMLPGALYVNIALSAMREAYPGASFRIENLRFIRPVRIDAHSAFYMRFVMDEANNSFSVATTSALWPRTFDTVAEGAYRQVSAGSMAYTDTAGLTAAYTHSASGADMYAALSKEYTYGPAFQGIDTLYIANTSALCRLAIPQPYCDSRHAIHPAALDIIFQSLFGPSFDADHTTRRFEIPSGVDSIRVYNKLQTTLFAHAHLITRDETGSTSDINVYSEEGQLIIAIKGFRTQSLKHDEKKLVSPALAAGMGAVPVWLPVPVTSAATISKRHFIILPGQHQYTSLLVDTLRAAGHSVTTLGLLTTAAHSTDEQLHQVAGELANLLSIIPSDSIIINCMPLDAVCEEDVAPMICHPFITLARAIQETGFAGAVWSVTKNAAALPGDKTVNMFQAGASGIASVFRNNEFTTNGGGLIDIEGEDDLTLMMSVICATDHTEDCLAIRNKTVYARRLQPHTPSSTSIRPRFSAQSEYLLTGALGDLGKEVVKWMIDRGARKLLLTTSRKPGADGRYPGTEWLQPLQKMADITLVHVDFDDTSSVSNLVSFIGGRDIKGVIYMAGVSKDQLIHDIDTTTLQKVLKAKITGACSLHNALLHSPLEHFIIFSSAGSLITNRGMAAYATANAVLDALAWHRQSIGLPALSINWGPWNMGMVQQTKMETALSMIGMNSFSAAQGIQMLEKVFFEPQPQVLVQYTNWAKLLPSAVGNRPLLQLYQDQYRHSAAAIPATDNRTDAGTALKNEIASLLDTDASTIDIYSTIEALGMESISVMILSDTIKQNWGVQIPMEKLSKELTIEDIIMKILLAENVKL